MAACMYGEKVDLAGGGGLPWGVVNEAHFAPHRVHIGEPFLIHSIGVPGLTQYWSVRGHACAQQPGTGM